MGPAKDTSLETKERQNKFRKALSDHKQFLATNRIPFHHVESFSTTVLHIW